jgi:acetyl esterase/lipase
MIQRILILALIIGFTSCSNEPVINQTKSEALAYKEIRNVSYGTDVNQVYDIYLPENRTNNTKTIILIHGGGWTSGDKTDMNALKDLFRQNLSNVALVNINYRLADENNLFYPMQINDISSVVNHLKSHTESYVISENYGFVGVSAGGHLALLWSYAFDTENNVNMVASIVGPTNFTDPAYLNNGNPLLQILLDTYGVSTSTDFLEEISPLHQATAIAPPTILFYGGQDPLIPVTQGTGMKDQLNLLGVVNEFTLYPNAGHGWVGPELLDTWNKLKTFTEAYL